MLSKNTAYDENTLLRLQFGTDRKPSIRSRKLVGRLHFYFFTFLKFQFTVPQTILPPKSISYDGAETGYFEGYWVGDYTGWTIEYGLRILTKIHKRVILSAHLRLSVFILKIAFLIHLLIHRIILRGNYYYLNLNFCEKILH